MTSDSQIKSGRDLALYIHLPWCVKKCPYCDFNSHALRDDLPEDEYVTALLADLDQELALVGARPIHSVFFGGGTPSLFSAAGIERILHGVRERLTCAADWEVTLEANPGTVEHGRFTDYAAAGVNRISLGAQSFDDTALHRLGRIHGAADIPRAVEELHQAGITNFNLDIMYGLPEQPPAAALHDVQTAIALAPAHLSHYELTLEPNTLFAAKPPPLPDEETKWAMQESCQALLAEAGYAQYEISAYARAGRECRHNLNYWRYGDYLGIGAGAHGKLTLADGNLQRYWKLKHPRDYLRHAASAARLGSTQILPPAERVFEFMLNVLRLREGFALADFTARTGLSSTHLLPRLQAAAARGLLFEQCGRWCSTETGWRHLDTVQALFLPDAEPAL